MPPRRGARRKPNQSKELKSEPQTPDKLEGTEEQSKVVDQEGSKEDAGVLPNVESQNSDVETKKETKNENEKEVVYTEFATSVKIDGNDANNGLSIGDANSTELADALPFKVRVSHLPATYFLSEFQNYIQSTFQISVPKIISPAENSPWLLIPFATKEEQEGLIKMLHNHVWKKKALRAIAFHAIDDTKRKAGEDVSDNDNAKKPKLEAIPVLTLEEEILSESLPLFSVPYEEQNRLTVQDVELLSSKLHAFMCVRNPDLAGWAEAMCEKNGGFIYQIEPLKPSPFLEGYRNKCKFRIGKNADGETTVGFCLNDNENKILGVQPGDKLIHLPDSMKYAAKKFEEYIRASGKEPYDKRKKSGFWDHIIIRIAPEGELMLVVVMYHNQQSEAAINEIRNSVKEYFINGNGKDCKLFSLYFQVMGDKVPILAPDKLTLLVGETSFQENICGLKFHVGPFSILNVNSPSAENIYKSITELAEPTSDTTVIDLCSGTGGIAFTIAKNCEKVFAIESQEDNVNDALKTMKLNNIQNVEFVKGKVEDELHKIFKNLEGKPVIPVIDPPRQGLVQKAISQLRANKDIKKLVYVCSNSKMGVKNFLDLCASAEKREGTFGNPLNVEFLGLPFLPVKAVPVDVAPYTVNNTIVILFERIDPTTFPPAKNPPPLPIKKPQAKKDQKKSKKGPQRRQPFKPGFRGPKAGGPFSKNRFEGPPRRAGPMPPRTRAPGIGSRRAPRQNPGMRMGMGPGPGPANDFNRFPPPLMTPMEPALSLVAKYERRIAELEQQDRAFKAGLSMGLQALRSRSSGGSMSNDFGGFNNGNFRDFDDFRSNASFDDFRRGNFKDDFNPGSRLERSGWIMEGDKGNLGNFSSYGNNSGSAGNGNFGGGFGNRGSFSGGGSGSNFGCNSGGAYDRSSGSSGSNNFGRGGNNFGGNAGMGGGFGSGNLFSGAGGRFNTFGSGNNFNNSGGSNNFKSKGGGFRNYLGNKQRR